MGRKKKTSLMKSWNYPVFVRLIKSDNMNKDKIVCNDIELYSCKDTIIADEQTLIKLNGIKKHLRIIESAKNN